MKNFATKLIAGAMLVGAASMAHAAEIGVDLKTDLGAITPGVTNSLTTEGEYYTYQATQSGPITIQTNYTGSQSNLMNLQNSNSFFMFYEYHDIFLQMQTTHAELVEGQGWSFIFNVEAESNYIIGYTDLIGRAGAMEFTLTEGDIQEVSAQLNYCLPTPGTTFDPAAGINHIVIGFDQTISSVDGVCLSYTDNSGEPKIIDIEAGPGGYSIDTRPSFLRIDYFNQYYMQAKKDADYSYPFYIQIENLQCGAGPVTSVKLSEGDEFVTISEGSNIAIEYNFVDNTRMTSASVPNPFYAFWPEGTAAGMAVLTFDTPIDMSGAQLTLVMGEHQRGDDGGSGDDPDPFFIPSYILNDDNTVLTIDFTGVDYSAELTKNYEVVTLMLTGVYGENGLVAIMGDPEDESSTVNYFHRIIPFVNETYDPAGIESILSDGESIKGVYNIHGVKVNPDKIDKGLYIVNGKKVLVK